MIISLRINFKGVKGLIGFYCSLLSVFALKSNLRFLNRQKNVWVLESLRRAAISGVLFELVTGIFCHVYFQTHVFPECFGFYPYEIVEIGKRLGNAVMDVLDRA